LIKKPANSLFSRTLPGEPAPYPTACHIGLGHSCHAKMWRYSRDF
jgi:hypothetical protein